jgi:hypothetical protein
MESLSKILPNWSSLRTLGQSRVVALTALIPFIGSLILFNQQIVDFLLLSPDLVAHWLGKPQQEAVGASRAFTSNRLVVTYFGLVALGTASFLFAMLCPPEVKRHGSALAHIEAEKPLVTPARTSLMVTQVVEDYLVNHGEEEARGNQRVRELAYPFNLILFFEEVIRQISKGSIEGDDADIYSGNGNIYIENVARILRAQRRAQRGLWMSFHGEAEKHQTDLLALIYDARDHSMPVARAIISALYAVGFLILFYPTATTLFLISRRALFPW